MPRIMLLLYLPIPILLTLKLLIPTMTTKPGILPREGLYIDPIFNYLRQTLLHPLFTLGCLYLVHGAKLSAVVPYEKSVQLIAGTSFFLWLNDWLSAKSRNNWVIDDSWDWKKELVVVTGGSGGIGGGVAQRLAAMGARVIVLDITPLTYKPGNMSELVIEYSPLPDIWISVLIQSKETERIIYYRCDLSDEKEIAAICDKINSEIGHPTVLGG
jgi:hypothetical protein